MALPSLRPTRLTSTLPSNYSRLFKARFHRFTRQTPATEIAASIRKDGACIIQSFYSPSQITRFNADIDSALSKLAPGRPDLASSDPSTSELGAEFLKTFHGENTKRLWDLCTISETWREELLDHEVMHDICGEGIARSYGDYWLSTASVIEIGPRSAGQPLHVDGAQWWPFWEMSERAGNEMLLNFLVACCDTTVENGATCVIPGSHLLDYSQFDPDSMDEPEEWKDELAVPVALKAGDCLLVGGRIVHKGGANRTADEKRRVLTATVVNSAFTPEEAHALLIGEDTRKGLSERGRRFLGLDGGGMFPKESVGIWNGSIGLQK